MTEHNEGRAAIDSPIGIQQPPPVSGGSLHVEHEADLAMLAAAGGVAAASAEIARQVHARVLHKAKVNQPAAANVEKS